MNPLCEDQYALSDVNIASTIIAFWQSPEAKLGSCCLNLCMNIICTNCSSKDWFDIQHSADGKVIGYHSLYVLTRVLRTDDTIKPVKRGNVRYWTLRQLWRPKWMSRCSSCVTDHHSIYINNAEGGYSIIECGGRTASRNIRAYGARIPLPGNRWYKWAPSRVISHNQYIIGELEMIA